MADARRTVKDLQSLQGRPVIGTGSGSGGAGGSTSRPRLVMPPQRSTSNMANLLAFNNQASGAGSRRTPSFATMALDLASDLGDNRGVPDFGGLSGLPASFSTQFALATRGNLNPSAQKNSRMRGARAKGLDGRDESNEEDEDTDSRRMSRIMLARMTTLEEGFRDVLREVKTLNLRSRRGSEVDEGPGMGSRVGSRDGIAGASVKKPRSRGTGGETSPALSHKKEKGKGKKRAGDGEAVGGAAAGRPKTRGLGAPFPSLSDGVTDSDGGEPRPKMGSSA